MASYAQIHDLNGRWKVVSGKKEHSCLYLRVALTLRLESVGSRLSVQPPVNKTTANHCRLTILYNTSTSS